MIAIKYIRSGYSKGSINLILPTPNTLETSVAYMDKANEQLVWKVVGEESDIETLRVNMGDGVYVDKPASPLSPVRVMTLFPLSKIIQIRASQDPGIKAILQILDDPRLTEVDRNQPFFAQAINYISTIVPLTPEEVNHVLTGG